ncbi:Adaptive-response sensory-kinase SasA [Pseudoalteromonas holothuriae]|uniref:histidine kinase n=1 Tax=Pseudoalteromonas holothuriae TaxID=2963714 RepID=A0A9W4VUL7_9GAMM|nr:MULTISPECIES: sensor histidine kinase [unclassified Pseudoalteromonas]CAH9063563.1 Adaptive-response sensory-kinase SasA [Pseudoalteromonas sp. CIP111951]CAH9064706.1 Adaptive-response sensory-kinase SasA [Pseudoalteromonas sp. CIP111854]
MDKLIKALNTSSFVSLSAVIIVAAIIFNAVIGLKNITNIATIQKDLTKASEVMLVIDSLHIDLLNAESSHRGFLISEKNKHLTPFTKALEQFELSLERTKQVQSHSHLQQQRIAEFTRLAQIKLDSLKASIELAAQSNVIPTHRILEDVENSDIDLRNRYSIIIHEETLIRLDLLKRLDIARANSKRNVVWFTALSILLCGAILLLLIKHLKSTKAAKLNLEQYNATLEQKVQARTHALEVYAEELNRSNRELEDFAFVASHDLQEPLRKIRAFGDRLTTTYGEQLGDKGQDYLARMNSAAMRMSTLITDLLELSRVTTRGKPFIEVDLNLLLSKVIEDLEVAIEDSHSKVTVHPLPQITADASQLTQLFSNLISNAIKFRRANEPPVIDIKCEVTTAPEHLTNQGDESWIKITVTDNGIGFDSEYQEKIFTPFQRLHSRKDYAGTGIGLAVCRRIIERHGGEISASSPAQTGAVFTMLLPIDANIHSTKDNKHELLKTTKH